MKKTSIIAIICEIFVFLLIRRSLSRAERKLLVFVGQTMHNKWDLIQLYVT